MKIKISGAAKVSIYGTPKDEVRRLLAGSESQESCCQHLPQEFRNAGISGGKIRLVLNDDSESFSVVTEYHVPNPLEEEPLRRLAKCTVGQWSSGIGETCFEEIGRKLGARIVLRRPSKDDSLSVEQIDDGLSTAPPTGAVYRAARNGDLAAVCRLIEAGEDINQGSDGVSPLITAVLSGFPEVALKLIEQGANVHYASPDGIDALMATAMSNRMTDAGAAAVTRALLRLGVDVHAKRGSVTPLQMARIRRKTELEQVLAAHGASE